MKHFLILLVIFTSLMFHVEAGFKNYPQELGHVIQQMEKLPEAQALVDEVQTKGPIKVVYLDMSGQELEGFWNASSRTIEVNRSVHQSEGRLISTILFELHNAQSSDRLVQLTEMAKKNLINKDNFVRSVEQMEHRNALHASHLLEKGIKEGFYPKDAAWPIYIQFEDHFKVQQLMDHSKWIADHYDQVNKMSDRKPMKGTIPGINKFTQQDKRDFLNYLSIKNDLESPFEGQRQRGFNDLNKVYVKLEATNSTRKLELMDMAMNNHPVYKKIKDTDLVAQTK